MRTRLLTAVLLLGATTACEQNGFSSVDPDGPGGNGQGGDEEDIPWDEGTDGREIWDEVYLHEPCKEYVDPTDGMTYQVPGAARFFAGDYEIDDVDMTVSGKEYLLLVANAGWEAAGEDDCQVVWNVTGTLEDGTCAACDFIFNISATMNDGETDCPQGFTDLEREFEESYDVVLFADGTTQFLFLDTQNEFGKGWWAGTRAAWISEPACYWF